MQLYAFAALLSIAAASPASPANPAFCSAVTKIVSLAKAQAAATSYCSQYLSLPPQETVLAYPSFTSFGPDGRFVTTVTCQTPSPVAAAVVKPAVAAKKPPCLNSYNNADKISSACSCLSIPTATTVTTDVFKILASGAPNNNGQFALKPAGADATPTVAFQSPSKTNSPSWKLGYYNDRTTDALIAQDGSGIGFLGDCSISSGTSCSKDAVMVGRPADIVPGTFRGDLALDCRIQSGNAGTCSLSCGIDNGNNRNVIKTDGTWRVSYFDGDNFTPIIAAP